METYVPASTNSAENMAMQQYQTLDSNISSQHMLENTIKKAGSKHSLLQLINEEEEKQNIQNFLDEDINEIDHNQNYASKNIKKDQRQTTIKRRRTEQNLNQ